MARIDSAYTKAIWVMLSTLFQIRALLRESRFDSVMINNFKCKNECARQLLSIQNDGRHHTPTPGLQAGDDADEIFKTVVKEVNCYVEKKHWELVNHEEVPKGMDIVPFVWAMRLKCNLTTNKVTKYKARFNVHGVKHT